MAFKPKEIGTSTTRDINCYVCRECGFMIDETGLCSDTCANDVEVPSLRPAGSVVTRTYRRVDTLISEEMYAG